VVLHALCVHRCSSSSATTWSARHAGKHAGVRCGVLPPASLVPMRCASDNVELSLFKTAK
jgi:hypothetical protein